jgi:hypothetical protein
MEPVRLSVCQARISTTSWPMTCWYVCTSVFLGINPCSVASWRGLFVLTHVCCMEQREAIKGLMKKSEIQGTDIDYVLMGYVSPFLLRVRIPCFLCFSTLIHIRMAQYGYSGGSYVKYCARGCNGCWHTQQRSCQHSHTRMHLEQRGHCRRHQTHSDGSSGYSLGRWCGNHVGSSHQVSLRCVAISFRAGAS